MDTIQLPYDEYKRLQEKIDLLENTELLEKINKLVDLLYEDKYGFFLNDYTEDLTEYSINNNWKNEPNPWDKL